MLSSLAALGCLAIVASGASPKQDKLWWVFLVKGVRPAGTTQADIEKMQEAHINNFKRLFGEKKLLTAGPMQDPTQRLRGVVLLTVKNRKDVDECFKPDPYVQSGTMKVEASEVKVDFGQIHTEHIDPNGIVENRIVVFSKGQKKPSRKDLIGHADWLKSHGDPAGLAVYVSFTKSDAVQAVALFRGADDAAIEDFVKGDPLVTSGALEFVKMPQWFSKGVLGDGPSK